MREKLAEEAEGRKEERIDREVRSREKGEEEENKDHRGMI